MQDLSSLAANSMTVTSQEGGNLVHDNSPAMTAPGSQPVTPLPAAENMPKPNLDVGAAQPVGTPAGRHAQNTSYSPPPMTWQSAERRG